MKILNRPNAKEKKRSILLLRIVGCINFEFINSTP